MKVCLLQTRELGQWTKNYLHTLKNVEVVEEVQPDMDLLLSVNHTKILPKEILDMPKLGAINVHHSAELRIRGRHTCTHAILLARKINSWFHGTCLHYMIPELDAGPIIGSRVFEISKTNTAWDLFNRCETEAKELIKDIIPRVLKGEIMETWPPMQNFYTFREKDLPNKQINHKEYDHLSEVEKQDLIRALTCPPHEGPYNLINNRKVYL